MSLLRQFMLSFVPENLILLVFWLGTAWIVYGAIWRLYFSPLAAFPGPRLAALTFWNEFYYDVVLKGQYTWKILDYHHQYGTDIKHSTQPLKLIDLQGPSLGSTLASFTLMIPTSSACCMSETVPARQTNGGGRYEIPFSPGLIPCLFSIEWS